MKNNNYNLALREESFLQEILNLIEEPEEYKLGINYLKEGDIEQALREFKSKSFSSFFNLGLLYWFIRDFSKAVSAFQEAFNKSSSGPDKTKIKFFYFQSLFFLSLWYFNKRDFSPLESLLKEIENISISFFKTPKEDYFLYKLMKSLVYLMEGILYLKENRSAEALSCFKVSLKLNKKSPLTLYYMGMVMAYFGKFSKASHYIKRALVISPSENYLLSAQKLISWQEGKEDFKDVNPFLSIDDFEPVTVRNFSWILLQRGSPDIILKYLDNTISIYSYSSSLFLYKGLCLEGLTQFEEGLSCYQKAFELAELGVDGEILLGRAFYLYNHYDKAKEFFEKALKKKEDSPYLLAYLAEIALKEGNYSEAILHLEALIKKENSIPLLLYLMDAYYITGNTERALEISLKAILYDSDLFYRPFIRLWRALIYLETDKLDYALKELNDCLRFDSNNPLALSYKGFIIIIKAFRSKIFKNWNEGFKFFREALMVDLECGLIYLHLFLAYNLTGDKKKREWALANLLRFEINERDLKIFNRFFPSLQSQFKDRIRIKTSYTGKLSSLFSDEELLKCFSPFRMFMVSREEELLFFYNVYRSFLNLNSIKNFTLSILSGTLKAGKIMESSTVNLYKKLLKNNRVDYILLDILNDTYLQNKDISSDAIENYFHIFSLNPDKVANTLFLSKILKEREEHSETSIAIYEKCYKLNPSDKDNLIVLVRALLMNDRKDPPSLELYRDIYFRVEDFPQKDKLLEILVNRYLSNSDKEQEALKIYRDSLRANIDGELKNSVNDFLVALYVHERRLDSFALQVYLDKYTRTPEDKELINICASALLIERTSDRIAGEIYRKALILYPQDSANFLMRVYSELSDSSVIEQEKAYSIILSDPERYTGDFWHKITSSIIKSLADSYVREEKRDLRALQLYRRALNYGSSDEKLRSSFLLTSLEHSCIDPLFIEVCSYFFDRSDPPVDLIKKVLPSLEKIYHKNMKELVSIDILYYLARLNLHLHRYDGANKFINLISVDELTHRDTYLKLARLYLYQGNTEKSSELYRVILERFSDNDPESIRELGKIYRNTDEGLSLEYFKKLLSLYPDDRDATLALGEIALSRKSYEEAYRYFLSLHKNSPGDPVSLERLALVYYYIDKIQDSYEILETLYKKGVKFSSEGAFVFAKILDKKEKHIESLKWYTIAIEGGITDISVYLERGLLLRFLGRLKSASYDFGEFIRRSSDITENYLEALINLAELSAELGDISSSLIHWKKAYTISLKLSSYQKNYVIEEGARLVLKARRYSSSELPILYAYLKIFPEDEAVLLYYISEILYSMGKEQEARGNEHAAERIYNKIISNLEHMNSLIKLGEFSRKRGDVEKAMNFLERASERGSLPVEVYRELSKYYLLKNDMAKSIKHLQSLMRQSPEKEEILILADLLFKINEKSEIINVLEMAIEKGFKEDRIYYLLARTYFELFPENQKNLQKAIKYCREIKNIEENREVIELLGQLYIKTGEDEPARKEFLKLPSDSPQRYYNLGLLFFTKGEFKDSQDCFEMVLELDPDYKDVRDRLALTYLERKSYNPKDIAFLERLILEKNVASWTEEKLQKALEHIHNYYIAHSEWEKGVNLLEASLEINSLKTDHKLWAWLALDFINLNNHEKASAILNNLPLQNPEEEVEGLKIHRIFAEDLILKEDYNKARVIYEKIYKCDPEYTGVGKMLEMLSKDRVGRFALIRDIGSGANAKIWEAFDLVSLRTVALKILHPEHHLNESIKKELQREYKLLMEINLPYVVNVIPDSMGETYFAMELLDRSLSDILREKPGGMEISEILELSSQISEMLQLLHQNNIIYQDLAPDNIMFSGKTARLCDFGGAKKIDPTTGKTIFGGTVAHLAYASPEQCEALAGAGEKKVDYRTDIYSFGVLLYEIITGELPFNLPDTQLISAHQYSLPVPPLMKRENISKQMNDLIMKCMSKKPEDRFQDMKEIWVILQQIPRW